LFLFLDSASDLARPSIMQPAIQLRFTTADHGTSTRWLTVESKSR
jgi:hypothetical protein